MPTHTDPLPPTSAVLVAAGSSTRMGHAGVRKPFLLLEGVTVLEHAARAFDACSAIVDIVVVAHVDDLARLQRLVESSLALRKVRSIVAGGELRADSVRAGMRAIDPASVLVAIHDAARPLIETVTIERAILMAASRGAALVASPVTDTIKTSPDGEYAERTLDRSVLWSAETPQVFRVDRFRWLLERAEQEGFRPTDDAALYERFVGPVPIVAGSARNSKITSSEDLEIAGAVLRARAATRKV